MDTNNFEKIYERVLELKEEYESASEAGNKEKWKTLGKRIVN